MKTKRTRWWLKSAALLCATVFGLTAFGAKDQIWSGGASGSWSGENVWTDGTYESGNYVVNDSTQDVAISFDSATTIDTGLWIENGGSYTVTFSGTGSAGLTAGSFNIGTGTGAGNLKLASGQYVSNNDVTMSNGGTGILTLEGGALTCGSADTAKWFLLGNNKTAGTYDTTVNLNEGGVLEVWHIQRYTTGGTCKINFNGGTLRALGDNQQLVGDNWPAEKRYPTIVVGEKGGTIDTNGKTVTIDAPVTGTGTLTVTGGGTATFTSTPYCPVVAGDSSTTVVLPEARAAVVDLDFEDASTTAWTKGSYNNTGTFTTDSRTLVQTDSEGTPLTSTYFSVRTGTGSGDRNTWAYYNLPEEVTTAGEYAIEFDWFAAQNCLYGTTSLDMGVYLYADTEHDDPKIKIVANPQTLNENKAQIYLNGSSEPETTTIDTAAFGAACNGTNNQDKWYRIVVKASAANGVTLEILKNDLSTVAFAETKVCDFVNLKQVYLDMNKRRNASTAAYGGIDNFAAYIPAVATINGTGYATLAAAGAAAKEGDTIILADDINLESSATITWGAKVAFAGHTLTTTTEGVEVLFDNGTHKLASTTEDGTTTFSEEIVTASDAFIWTGAGTADENGFYAWSDTANWQGGAAPSLATDNVFIGAGDAVTITGNSAMTGVLYIDRDVTITGSWTLATVNGTGTLKVDGVTLSNAGDFTVNCDLDTANSVYVASGSLTLNGALKGTGTITHNNGGAYSDGFQFYGDTSAFAGSYTGCTRASNSRDKTKFHSPAFGSANAYWQFGFEGSQGNDKNHAFASSGEYHFGTLDSQALKVLDETGVTLVIGERAGTSTLVVNGGLRDATNKIVKANPAEGTSTLNLTLTAATDGAVEVEAGVLNLNGENPPTSLAITGTDATVVVASTCGTTTTETVVVTEAVVDDPATEEDETQAAVTQKVSTFTPFKPVLSADLAAAYYQLKSVAGESATTYTVADVVQDADGNTYKTIAAALAAIADAENKTLTVIFDTNEPVVLPAAGYSLNTDGHATGTVSGATGVGVTVADGVYTSVDNTSATWKGAASGANWAEAANWSTGAIPDEGTVVKFTYNALVYISDHDGRLHKFNEMNISDNVTVEFAPTNKEQSDNIYPRLNVYGDSIDGRGTIKLFRCGISNQHGSRVTVYPNVEFENDGTHDSWFQEGEFQFGRSVTGTGLMRFYTKAIFNADLYIPANAFVECRVAPTISDNDYSNLRGSGTLVSWGGFPGGKALTHLQDADDWTGTLEIYNYTHKNVFWISTLGNANSTVRFNKVTTYLFTSSGTGGSHSVGTMEIGPDGFKINGNYSSGNFVFPGKLIGTGTFTVGTAGNNGKNVQFTGDCSEFAGTIAWASDTANTRVVVGDDTSAEFAAKTIVVNEDATIGLSGFGGTLVGSGTVLFKAATGLGTFGEAWTGVAVADFALTSGDNCELNSLGTANSVVANGRAFTGHLNGSYSMVPALRLDYDFTFNNGSSSTTAWPEGKITKFARILGEKNLNITWDNPNAGAVAYYEVEKVDGSYTGTINVSAKSALRIDEVALDAAPEAGVRIVKLAVTSGGSVVNADTESVLDGATVAMTVGGEASEAKAVYAADGLYVAVAKVGDDYYTTYETAAAAAEEAAEEGETPSFTVVYGDGALNGWDYDSENGTLTKNTTAIARVGTTNYDTLAAAVTAAGADGTVVLFGNSVATETVTVPAGVTVDVASGVTLAGKVTGAGTVVLASAVTDALVDENWTGTVVLNWTLTNGINVPTYCNSNSTLALAGSTGCYFAAAGGADPKDLAAFNLRIDGDVKVNNAWPSQSVFGKGVAIKNLSGTGNLTFDYQGGYSAYSDWIAYYSVETLGEIASITLANHVGLKISSVQVGVAPDFGDKVVALTVNDGSYLYNASTIVDGAIATDVEGVVLARGADGLYRAMAVANGVGYLTLADAITAANGATVTLVGDTTDGYEVQAGQTVKIFWNGHTTGEFTFATATVSQNTAWDETTGVTTYSCKAAGAYATVGGTVTYHATAQEAYNTANAGAIGDSFTVLDGSISGDVVDGFTYDSETATYTKVATIASITVGVTTYNYTTLAKAVAAAEEHEVTTVTLLVAKDSIEEAVPDGWEYNAPAEGDEGFGTLTKVVIPEPTEITITDDSCNFKVDATTAAAIAAVTGVDTTNANFGKAAIAYVVGGKLEDGEVVIPTPTITVNGTTVTVVYDSETANASAYTVTCTLYSFSLADANDSTKWTPVVSGPIGTELKDTEASAANKFYKVGVTVEDKDAQVGNETGSGQGA